MAEVTSTEQEMIKEWLKTNEPSVKIKDEPIPHLEQKMASKDG